MPEITRTQSQDEIEQLETRLYEAGRKRDEQAIAIMHEALAHPCAPHVFDIAGLHGDIATALREMGRYGEAIEEMQSAIATGYRSWPLPEVEIAELHLLAGRREIAAELFAEVRKQTPDDVWLYNSAGFAYAHVGDHESSVAWFTDGIEMAMADGDLEGIVAQMSDGRDASLKALNRGVDDLSERAVAFSERWVQPPIETRSREFLGEPSTVPEHCDHCGWNAAEIMAGIDQWAGNSRDLELSTGGGAQRHTYRSEPTGIPTAVAWFPKDEWSRARKTWAELSDYGLPEDHDAYCHYMQGRLLALTKAGISQMHVTPIAVDDLIAYAASKNIDAGLDSTRAKFAAEQLSKGIGIAWPPGRNDACWCGSGRKYKKCCLLAPVTSNASSTGQSARRAVAHTEVLSIANGDKAGKAAWDGECQRYSRHPAVQQELGDAPVSSSIAKARK